jgi:hypothetical protein
MIGVCNRDGECLLHGTNWVFKYNGFCFLIKGLMEDFSALYHLRLEADTVWKQPVSKICEVSWAHKSISSVSNAGEIP